MRITGTPFFVGSTAWPGTGQSPANMVDGNLGSGFLLSTGQNAGQNNSAFFSNCLIGIRFSGASVPKLMRLSWYSLYLWQASNIKVSGYLGANPTTTGDLSELDLLGEWALNSGDTDSSGVPIASAYSTPAKYEFLLQNDTPYDGIVFWTDSATTGVMWSFNPLRVGFAEIEVFDAIEPFITQVPQSVLAKDSSATPIQTTQAPQAILAKDKTLAAIQTTQAPQAVVVKETNVTPIQTTQVPQAILAKDFDLPNVRVGTMYLQIAYSFNDIPINVTQVPRAVFLKDPNVTPIQTTQVTQGLLVKQGPTERRFTQIVQALLVKEDPTEFFLNFRPLILPEMKTLYRSSQSRAFMVGGTNYIQLEGNLPAGSHLIRNGQNVGLTTPVANGDVFEVMGGVMNYFTTSILIYRYEWDGAQTIRELVGLWPVTQPELSPVPRWANNRRRSNKQRFISDYVSYTGYNLRAVWHEVNTTQPELTPIRHKFSYTENSVVPDTTDAKVFKVQLEIDRDRLNSVFHQFEGFDSRHSNEFVKGLVAKSSGATVYKLDKSRYIKVVTKETVTDRKSYVSAAARVNNILNSGYLLSYHNIQKGTNDFVSDHIRQFIVDEVKYERGVKGTEHVVYDQFDRYYGGAEIATAVSYEKVDSRLTKVQIDYIDRTSNAETFGVEQTAMHAVIRKIDQHYEKHDITSTMIRQFFVKFQFFPKDTESGVIPVYYDAVVGNSIFIESKYQRNDINTKEVSRGQFLGHAAIQYVDQSYLFSSKNVFAVDAWYSKYEYRPQMVKTLYTDRKEKVVTISSPLAIVPSGKQQFYYSAGRYGGFNTLQQMQTFTEYFDGVKAISTYNGYRYTTSVDQTFACELFSNGPIKWLLQGG